MFSKMLKGLTSPTVKKTSSTSTDASKNINPSPAKPDYSHAKPVSSSLSPSSNETPSKKSPTTGTTVTTESTVSSTSASTLPRNSASKQYHHDARERSTK